MPHSHIVTVFDLGQEDGAPYMVTELMGGGDVEGVLEAADDDRIPLEQAIDIALAVCRGLEFAHSRGIVHRDLKPGNVWLSENGVAKIGDFGLAVAIDRSRLTQQGMMVGTFSYMPPEQALGGEVTPRSDLYSLGAMLYEMVTGRPPFLGDDHVAIIGQHINTAPVAPSWHCQTCPKPLEALILRLLAKDPAERPDSASDVLKALEAIDPSATEAPDEQQQNVLDSLAGGVFVGRKAEMGDLKAALEEALSGRGRMVTLVGEPGIGKTRTAQELVTFAGLRGMQVLWGRCYEEQGVPPYWPWVQAIRAYVHERDAKELRSELGSAAAVIAEIVPDVRDALPGLEPPPEVGRDEARFRLLDSVATFLKAASRSRPLMLVLDDLHWADDASLGLLQFVARELGNARVLVVGTYRDVELNRQHPLAETLAELTRERLFTRVLLRGLTAEDIGHFISLTSGVEPPKGLVTAVHRETEGNPLFVTEVVRLLVQEGELTPETTRERESWVIRIPESVREVIGRRLNRLSGRCNEVLTVAAVVGREFEMRALSALITGDGNGAEPMTEGMLLDALEEALDSRVIEELPGSVGRYQFTHALIQETLTDGLSLTRTVRLHARVADTLESLYGDRADEHAADLAHHFAQAETILGTEKLFAYSLIAGANAFDAHVYENAEAIYQTALTNADPDTADDDIAALLTGLGKAQGAALKWNDGWKNLTRAFAYYDKSGDHESAVAIATFPDARSLARGLTGATSLMRRASQLAEPDSLAEGRILTTLGASLSNEQGDYQGAVAAFGRSLDVARLRADRGLELDALASWCEADVFWGEYRAGLEKANRAVGLATALKRWERLLYALFYRAMGTLHAEDARGALEPAAEALRVAEERSNDRFWLVDPLFINAMVSYENGDLVASREYCERAIEISDDLPATWWAAAVELQAGNRTSADRHIDAIARSAAAAGHMFVSVIYLSALGMKGLISGQAQDLDDALDMARETQNFRDLPASFHSMGLAATASLLLIDGDAESRQAIHDELSAMAARTRVGLTSNPGELLGALDVALGKYDEAEHHFTESIDLFERGGFRLKLAWCLYRYGDTLLKRDAPGDREKAVEMLDRALKLARDIGMPPLMERVLARREILGA